MLCPRAPNESQLVVVSITLVQDMVGPELAGGSSSRQRHGAAARRLGVILEG